jgi:hypothetical protein
LKLICLLPAPADSHTLRRFLRARKHNLPKAKQMFLDQLQWRQENDVDSVLRGFRFEERERFLEFYPEGGLRRELFHGLLQDTAWSSQHRIPAVFAELLWPIT